MREIGNQIRVIERLAGVAVLDRRSLIAFFLISGI
jgi:hypothetical protein